MDELTIVSITGDVKTLFVKVSLPVSVASVPELGTVTFVVPTVVNVNAWLPVVKSFPKVMSPESSIALAALFGSSVITLWSVSVVAPGAICTS